MLNCIILMGRLTAAPELRTTQSGVSVCSFRVAVERVLADMQSGQRADFIDIVAWRSTAEFVSRYFSKGQMIVVKGSLQSRKWQDKDGNNRISWEIMADSVDFCGSKNDSSNNGNSAPATEPAAPIVADFTEVKTADSDLPFN